MANINNKREWFVQLVDTRKKKPVNDDSGQFQVYQAGVAARQNIYNSAGTLLTQTGPFVTSKGNAGFISRTMTDGQLSFYTNLSCSTVDISILTLSGRSYFLKALKPSNHRVDVDPEQTDFTLVTVLDDYASSTQLRTSGFTLRKGMIVSDAYLKSTRIGTGLSTVGAQTYNVGVAGDSDGFLDALSFSTTGYQHALEYAIGTVITAAPVLGQKLALFATGSAGDINGYIVHRKYFVPTATVLSFARGGAISAANLTAAWVATAGNSNRSYLFVKYELAPVEVAVTTD